MENSYAVYFDRQKIHFTAEPDAGDSSRYSTISRKPRWSAFTSFVESGAPSMAYAGPDPAKLFREFASMFHFVEAAGGLVADPTDYWLFIYKRNRWDLPKGMLDENETPENAAIREISEECGIRELHIIRKLEPTYHVYPLKGKKDWALKKTHWFFLRTRICCQAEPQTSEGIIKAEWKNPERLDEVMNNTYGNIKEMLQKCRPFLK